MNAVERRRQQRIILERSTKVCLLGPSTYQENMNGPWLSDACIYDLNNYGAFVATEVPLPRGSLIEVRLTFSAPFRPVPLHAVVVRRSGRTLNGCGVVPAGLGMCFVAKSPDECERVRMLVTMTLVLDLLNYGYDRRKNVSFWQSVIPSDTTLITTQRQITYRP